MTELWLDRLSILRVVRQRALMAVGVLLLILTLVLVAPFSAGAILGIPAEASIDGVQGLALSPTSWIAYVMDHLTLDIMVNCGANADGAGTTVTFNPAYLQVISITEDTSDFPNNLLNTYDNGTGTIRYDAGALLTCYQTGTCPSGMVRLATITFRATAETVGTTSVGVNGQVTWSGAYTFDGTGTGCTITVLPTPTPAPRDIDLAPDSRTVNATDHFPLDIRVDCGANADGAATTVMFDPRYVQVLSLTQDTTLFTNILRSTFDNGTGTVRYDAGAPLLCHQERTCPTGFIRIATITFRAVQATDPTTYIGISGQVTWSGAYVFDGPGSGSTISVLPLPTPVCTLRLPMIMRSHSSLRGTLYASPPDGSGVTAITD